MTRAAYRELVFSLAAVTLLAFAGAIAYHWPDAPEPEPRCYVDRLEVHARDPHSGSRRGGGTFEVWMCDGIEVLARRPRSTQ